MAGWLYEPEKCWFCERRLARPRRALGIRLGLPGDGRPREVRIPRCTACALRHAGEWVGAAVGLVAGGVIGIVAWLALVAVMPRLGWPLGAELPLACAVGAALGFVAVNLATGGHRSRLDASDYPEVRKLLDAGAVER